MRFEKLGFGAALVGLVVGVAASTAGCGSKREKRVPDGASDERVVTAPLPSASDAVASSELPAAPSASAAPSAVASAPVNGDPHIARMAALSAGYEFGMIGLLNSGAGGDPNAPTAPWGRDNSIGPEGGVRGNMWGDEIGDAYGAGGLGLSGIGEMGGGRGEGIGLGSVGSLGHGAGTSSGAQGFGRGGGGSGEGRGTLSTRNDPKVAVSARVVSGTLPPEVVTRILRSRISRLLDCYKTALKTEPTLDGVVALEFTIDATGATTNVTNPGAANAAGACMSREVGTLSYPQPEGGPVKVAASVALTPPPKSASTPSASAADETPSPAAGPTVEQIHGRTLDAASAVDVAEAMRDAGCTDVSLGQRDGITVITAKFRDAEIKVTFTAAGEKAVATEEATRLRSSAVVVERLGMFLAIEGPRALADALKRAIVVAAPVK